MHYCVAVLGRLTAKPPGFSMVATRYDPFLFFSKRSQGFEFAHAALACAKYTGGVVLCRSDI